MLLWFTDYIHDGRNANFQLGLSKKNMYAHVLLFMQMLYSYIYI